MRIRRKTLSWPYKLLIERVQKLSLNRVDARACDMGKNDVLMSAVQVFPLGPIFSALLR
jgi:hypothetical protein